MGRVAMVMTLVFAGCGAPQAPLDAGAENHPPRILETTPALRSTWYATNACPSLNAALRLTVEDLDGDVLHSLWFIDPTPTSPSWASSPIAGGAVKRTVTAPSASSFRAALANLPLGVHLVTAWVADADFLEPVDGQVSVTGTGATDSYTWVIDVEPCP